MPLNLSFSKMELLHFRMLPFLMAQASPQLYYIILQIKIQFYEQFYNYTTRTGQHATPNKKLFLTFYFKVVEKTSQQLYSPLSSPPPLFSLYDLYLNRALIYCVFKSLLRIKLHVFISHTLHPSILILKWNLDSQLKINSKLSQSFSYVAPPKPPCPIPYCQLL